MAAGATTGTYNFGGMYAADMVLEVYERVGWRTAALTLDMMLSAQRSFNFVQSRWSNLGVNLWEVSLNQILLTQGVPTYVLPENTIAVLPAPFVRNLPLTVNTNITPPFTTVLGSASVTAAQSNSGAAVGGLINVATPVAVGGIVLFGYYSIVSVPTPTTFTITAAQAALSSSAAGVLPTFTSDGTTGNIVVALTNQPFIAGQFFNVGVAVKVGGLTLQGAYPIVSASTNSFTINVTSLTTSVQTVTMNTGKALIQTATQGELPTDRVLYPLGRTDYTSLAVKAQQAPPTAFWFDRTTTPSITFWPVPDQNGPYQFNYYAFTQIQDASIQGGAVLDIPFRFFEAYAAACAAHLAMKWRPDIAPALMAYADKVWVEAADADREEVSWYVAPMIDGYFR